MREFTMDHAVSAMSALSSALSSLWGFFIVATFSAAGFGASMGDEFTPSIAVMLGIGFLAFAAAHLRVLVTILKRQMILADEVRERFRSDPDGFTHYPRALAVILNPNFSVRATCLVHLTIDACVIGVVAANAF